MRSICVPSSWCRPGAGCCPYDRNDYGQFRSSIPNLLEVRISSTAARLLRLLGLLQLRRDWTGEELATRLQVTHRTVRRDIDRLRETGYTVESRPGVGGGYALGPGSGVPPLLLAEDEAVAVAVALRSTTTSGVRGIDEAALGALLKVEQSLPTPLRRRVEVIGATVLPLPGAGPSVDVEVLLAVAGATRDHRRVQVGYRTHHGTESSRTLEPHRVVRVADRWYLVTWDLDRAAWRTLRLDRVHAVRPTAVRFAPREIPDRALAARVARGITAAPYRFQLRLTVLAPADVVGERVGPTRALVEAVDDRRCRVTGGGDDLDRMASWVAGLGVDCVVEEPRELRDHLRRLASRATRAADGPTHDPG